MILCYRRAPAEDAASIKS